MGRGRRKTQCPRVCVVGCVGSAQRPRQSDSAGSYGRTFPAEGKASAKALRRHLLGLECSERRRVCPGTQRGRDSRSGNSPLGGPQFPFLGSGWADTGLSRSPWELRELPPVIRCTGEALWPPWPGGALSGRSPVRQGRLQLVGSQTPCLVPKDGPWHPGARHPPSLLSLLIVLLPFNPPPPRPSPPLFYSSYPLSPSSACSHPPPLSPSRIHIPARAGRREKQGRFPSSPWRGSRQ